MACGENHVQENNICQDLSGILFILKFLLFSCHGVQRLKFGYRILQRPKFIYKL